MNATTTTKAKPLVVRRCLWRCSTEIRTPQGWQPVKDYAAARRYAEEHGYGGIKVRMI